MLESCWKLLLISGLLLPAAAAAEDEAPTKTESTQAPAAMPSPVFIPAMLEYESRWRLRDPVTQLFDDTEWPVATDDLSLAFEDGSSIMAVTKIRSLSLLTLSGDERSKWFLGVNEDGIVGVHFRGFTRATAKRHLDVSSMFSSESDEAGEEAR